MSVEKRRFKDLCADFCNQWSKWTETQAKSTPMFQTLANQCLLLIDPGASLQQDPFFDRYRTDFEFQTNCLNLKQILDQFVKISQKSDNLCQNMVAFETFVEQTGCFPV